MPAPTDSIRQCAAVVPSAPADGLSQLKSDLLSDPGSRLDSLVSCLFPPPFLRCLAQCRSEAENAPSMIRSIGSTVSLAAVAEATAAAAAALQLSFSLSASSIKEPLRRELSVAVNRESELIRCSITSTAHH